MVKVGGMRTRHWGVVGGGLGIGFDMKRVQK